MGKKLPLLALCLALIVSLAAFPAQAAETVIEVKPPTELPQAGETFTVTVEVTGNPGFNTVELKLGYDSIAMSCESAEAGDLISGMLYVTNHDAPEGAIVAGASLAAVEGDGVIAEFTFVAKENVTDYGFTLADTNLTDGDGNVFALKLKAGDSVAVVSPSSSPALPSGSSASSPPKASG